MTRQTAGSPSRARIGLQVLVAAAVLMGGFQAVGEEASAEPTIGEIEAAWKIRSQQLQSVECKWDVTRFAKAGSMTSPFGDANALVLPMKDRISHYSRALLYHNKMVRTEDIGGDYLAPTQHNIPVFKKLDITNTWNGKVSYSMHNGVSDYPTGAIRSKADIVYADSQFNWVYTACCLPSPGSVDLKEYRLEGAKRIDGEEVLVLQKRNLRPVDIAEVWLSPDPPYVVKRTISKGGGVTFAWQTIDYVPNEEGIEVPKAASSAFLDENGKYKSAFESTVTSFKINPPVNDSDFIVKFPHGTWVTDRSAAEVQSYIVRKDGEKRRIDPAEIRRGATYKQLLETEEGQAGLEVPEPANR